MPYVSCSEPFQLTKFIKCSGTAYLDNELDDNKFYATCSIEFSTYSDQLKCNAIPVSYKGSDLGNTDQNFFFAELDSFQFLDNNRIGNVTGLVSETVSTVNPNYQNSQEFMTDLVITFDPVYFGLIISACMLGLVSGFGGGLVVGAVRKAKNIAF